MEREFGSRPQPLARSGGGGRGVGVLVVREDFGRQAAVLVQVAELVVWRRTTHDEGFQVQVWWHGLGRVLDRETNLGLGNVVGRGGEEKGKRLVQHRVVGEGKQLVEKALQLGHAILGNLVHRAPPNVLLAGQPRQLLLLSRR